MKRFLILTLTFIIILSALGTLPVMAAPEMPVAERGVFYQDKAAVKATNTITVSKRTLTLQTGKSATLTVTLKPAKSGASITWESSNPKIAKVSSSGKVTAVAPGTVWVIAKVKNYSPIIDATGYSDECFVTVEGGSKDPKPLGASDQTFFYGSKKITMPAWTKTINYYTQFMNMLYSINNDCDIYESSESGVYLVSALYPTYSSCHTEIYYAINANTEAPYGFGIIAYNSKSPVKTNRGIKVGGTKSDMLKLYGLPSWTSTFENNGVTFEKYIYQTYKIQSGNALYMDMSFVFQKSKTTVLGILYYSGLAY